MNKEFELRKISDARPHLMGLATLWVVFFHSIRLNFYQPWLLGHPHLMDVLNRLREEGNCGVDIFFFLSGLGLFFSWTRLQETSEHPLLDFYKRRASRILPPVLVASVLYYGWIGTKGTRDWLGKILFLNNFSSSQEGNQYWFFALLLLLYLCYPLIWEIIDRWRTPGAMILIAVTVLGPLMLRRIFSETYFIKTEILWTRIPIFVVGVLCGWLIRRGIRIPVWIPIACLPLAALTWYEIRLIPEEYLFLRRYAYGVLTVFIALSHAWLCMLWKKRGRLYRIVTTIGSYSLEIYLIYEGLYLYNPIGFKNYDSMGIVYALTVFVATLLLASLQKTALDRLCGAVKAHEE